MVLFICSIVFGLIALLGLVAFIASNDDEAKGGGAILLVGAGLIALIFLGFASSTIVSTKNIGVVTTFGKPTGSLDNGLHFKAPWSKVTELDGAIQIDTREGDDATRVRLGNNSMAAVDNTVRWRIKQEAADKLFLDYRNFDAIKHNLVTKQLDTAISDVLATYNPLASLSNQQGEADINQKLATQVRDLLRERVGKSIEIESVLIPVVRFDEDTQKRIDQFNAELANTKIAEQKQVTAEAEAKANEKLRASVADQNVLVSKCLDIVAKSGGQVAGCWPGTGVIAGVK